MAHFDEAWREHRHDRFTRPGGERYLRPDWLRYLRPDPKLTLTPEGYEQWLRDQEVEVSNGVDAGVLNAEREVLLRLKAEVAAFRASLRLQRVLADFKAGFKPDQPRVPAGNPDGGQWTSESGAGAQMRGGETATDISSSRRGRPRGHHWVPQAIFKKYPFPDETQKVFDNATSGPIGLRAATEDGSPRGHYWDGPKGAHKAYSDAVDGLLGAFMADHNILPEAMTPDQARSFLAEIELSQDSRIRDYNKMIRLLRFLRMLRIGGRGVE
jgi:hypothetical protein